MSSDNAYFMWQAVDI